MPGERLFVVEDEGLVALALKRCLQGLGYKVAGTAASADEAVQKINASDPDLVLMDIRLKGETDGIELADWVRETRRIPVVFLTAHSDEKTLGRAKFTEPYGYIVKPFEEKSLHSTIEMALYKAAMQAELSRVKSKLDTVLRSIQEAVVVSDFKGQIDYINAAAERLLGFGAKDATQKSLFSICSFATMDTEKRVKIPVSRTGLKGETLTHENVWMDNERGERYPVDFTLAPVRSDEDVVTGLILTIRDISGRTPASSQ